MPVEELDTGYMQTVMPSLSHGIFERQEVHKQLCLHHHVNTPSVQTGLSVPPSVNDGTRQVCEMWKGHPVVLLSLGRGVNRYAQATSGGIGTWQMHTKRHV